MQTMSNGYNTIADGDSAFYYATIKQGNNTLEIELQDFKYVGMTQDDSDLTIGNTCSCTVTFSLYNPSISLTGIEIEISEGIMVDGSLESISLGLFTIQKPIINDELTTYTGYDRMATKTSGLYSSSLTYPATASAVMNEICGLIGLIMARSLPTTVLVNNKPEGYTYREVIGYMAALFGMNAIINRLGQLDFKWYTLADYTIDASRYYESGVVINDEENYILQKIECTVKSQDSSQTLTSGSGTHGISIENPFMTQSILDSIFLSIGNFTYRTLSVQFLGDFRLDLGDIVTVISNGATYAVPIMKIEHECDGGAISKITSFGRTAADSSMSASGPTTKAMDRYYAELVLINEAMINKLDVDTANITYATISNLNVLSERVGTLEADSITTTNLHSEVIRAGFIDASTIESTFAKTSYLTTTYATIDNLEALAVTVSSLEASQITTSYLNANYADIHLGNIAQADIGTLFADVGLISSATIVDGHVTGYLTSVKINADTIEAGTLSVDRLLITGANSIVYQINANSSGLSLSELADEKYNKYLNGTDIVANSITANQISANAITAEKIIANAITGDKILANAITTDKIKAGAVTADKLYAELVTAETFNAKILEIQNEIDGSIEIIYTDHEPTLNNYPACTWHVPIYPSNNLYPSNTLRFIYTDEEYEKHQRTLIFDTTTSITYRFERNNGNWVFTVLQNTDYAVILGKINSLTIDNEALNSEFTQFEANLDNNYYTITETTSLVTQTATSLTSSITSLRKDVEDNYCTTTQTNTLIAQSKTDIELSVSNTYVTQNALSSNYYNKTQMDSKLQVNEDNILASVSYTYASKQSVTSSLSLKVDKDKLTSEINASADTVKISGEKVNLTGAVSVNDNVKINTDGTLECVNAKVSGDVSSTNGVMDSVKLKGQIQFWYTSTYGMGASGYFDALHTENTGGDMPGLVCDMNLRVEGQLDVKYSAHFYSIANFSEATYFYKTSRFYGTVYNSSGGTVFTSDENAKHDIQSLDIEESAKFIYSLDAVEYKFNDNDSNRFHHGLKAQDVKRSMGNRDWGLYTDEKYTMENPMLDDDGNVLDEDGNIIPTKGLRYEELIADLIATVQSLNNRIKVLENQLIIGGCK